MTIVFMMSICLSVHMKRLHCVAYWTLKSFSEMSLDSFSLLNVVMYHFHFLLNRSNIDETEQYLREIPYLPHFPCSFGPARFAFVLHPRVHRIYKCRKLTLMQSLSV
jgi:hypothetical protein